MDWGREPSLPRRRRLRSDFEQPHPDSHEFTAALRKHGAFTVEPIPHGTNLFRLKMRTTDAGSFQKRLATRGVMLAAPQGDTFLVAVNETITRLPAVELANRFTSALEA